MKTKIYFLLLSPFFLSNYFFSQIKVTNNGRVGIGMNTPYETLTVLGTVGVDSYALPWGYSLYTKLHNDLACGYHLQYNNQDVFFVSAQGWLWAQTGGYFGSDSTLKKDILPILSPKEKLNSLNAVSFRYKSATLPDSANPVRYGFIAQDVQRTMPNLIKVQPNGLMGLTYTDIIPLLVEGYKGQQQEIDQLKQLIQLQQQQIDILKK
jgi:hypothetical protein